MAKAVKHQVIIDGVVIGERKSPRIYTHAIVARNNPHKAYARWQQWLREEAPRDRRFAAAWDAWERKVALCNVGDRWPGPRPDHGNYLASLAVDDYMIESAKKYIAANPTLADRLAKHDAEIERQRQKHLAEIADYDSGKVVPEPYVTRWSQSFQSAFKAAATEFGYADLKVVEVIRHG